MSKNRQQLLKEQKKRRKLDDRKTKKQAKKRIDLVDQMATFVYDRIMELRLLPFIQKEFKFDDVKTQRFKDKLAEHEMYNEMYRTNEPIDVELIRKWRPGAEGYKLMIQYTIEKAREILWFLGYSESQLKKKFDAKLPPFPEWDNLFKISCEVIHP